MIQKHLLCLLYFLGSTVSIIAQQITEAEQKANLASLQSDTSFTRFSSRVNALMKNSNGRQTNFAAIKKLFTANKTLLQELKLKHHIVPIQQENESPYQGPNDKPNIKKVVEKKKIYAIAPVKVVKYYPPHTEKEIHDYINPGMAGTAETGNYSNNGQIVITTSVLPGVAHWYDSYVFAFRQSVTVPNDPFIVKAHVRFYYHYYSTGWDTESGRLSTDLVINTSPNFVSPAYNQLASRNTPPAMASWKEIKRVASESFNSLREYSQSEYDSYIIAGNVTPGSTIDFKFGMSFTPYTNRVGDFGAYHYRSYRLIMIEVSYFKAD